MGEQGQGEQQSWMRLWDILMDNVQAIHRWFKNNRPFKDRAVFRLERKIPLRRVVGKIKASDIQRMVASKNPDIEKGDKSYPGLFQKALTRYMDGMDETEKDQLVKIRGEWQESGPPLDVQLRYADIAFASTADIQAQILFIQSG
jgi:hypothetical protein